MDSLSSFVASANQALILKKPLFVVQYSKLVKEVSFFLREQGYFSSVSVLDGKVAITLRYLGSVTAFNRFVLVSKSSKSVYFRSSLGKSGVFVVTNSEFSLSLRVSSRFVGGKVLLQIL